MLNGSIGGYKVLNSFLGTVDIIFLVMENVLGFKTQANRFFFGDLVALPMTQLVAKVNRVTKSLEYLGIIITSWNFRICLPLVVTKVPLITEIFPAIHLIYIYTVYYVVCYAFISNLAFFSASYARFVSASETNK